MSKFHLFEPCCGSAALTLHLLGAKRQILPYQGSKWSVRRELERVLVERGHDELATVHLNDAGPWGEVWGLLFSRRGLVIKALKDLHKRDAREVYEELQGKEVPEPFSWLYAAEFLFLQRLSFSGKAVGTREDDSGRVTWVSPGFNKTSAYGKPAYEGFGEIKPLIPSLIRQLETGWKSPEFVMFDSIDAMKLLPLYVNRKLPFPISAIPWVVYLDGPYMDSTVYPGGSMPRDSIVAFAECMYTLGATVIVSEAEPIDQLEYLGWETRCIKNPPGHNAPFRAKGAEWLTISPPRNA